MLGIGIQNITVAVGQESYPFIISQGAVQQCLDLCLVYLNDNNTVLFSKALIIKVLKDEKAPLAFVALIIYQIIRPQLIQLIHQSLIGFAVSHYGYR